MSHTHCWQETNFLRVINQSDEPLTKWKNPGLRFRKPLPRQVCELSNVVQLTQVRKLCKNCPCAHELPSEDQFPVAMSNYQKVFSNFYLHFLYIYIILLYVSCDMSWVYHIIHALFLIYIIRNKSLPHNYT